MKATILAAFAAISISLGIANTAVAGNLAAPVHQKSQYGTSGGRLGLVLPHSANLSEGRVIPGFGAMVG